MIGAIDGSHIPISTPASLHAVYRNRKGFLSQNALFICDFDLKFTYMLTRWEGSATDAHVFDDTSNTDLNIPPSKFLLADAGYPLQPSLLVPYQGVRYHLAEWGCASVRYIVPLSLIDLSLILTVCFSPSTCEELFNLHHASARNVVERIFGILKQHFRILLLPTHFPLDMQARIPAALCALHNFIYTCDPLRDSSEYGSDSDEQVGYDDGIDNDSDGGVVGGNNDSVQQHLPTNQSEVLVAAAANTSDTDNLTAKQMWDRIAQMMWDDYQNLLADRAREEVADDPLESGYNVHR